MKLSFENIGRISEAEIDFDGITVICGDNNVGKSTIGKVLYAIYKSFYGADKFINEHRNNIVKKEFQNLHSDFVVLCKNLIVDKRIEFIHNTDEIPAPNDKNGIVEYFASVDTLKTTLINPYVKMIAEKKDVEKVLFKYCNTVFSKAKIPESFLEDETIIKWKERATQTCLALQSISDEEILRSKTNITFSDIFFQQYLKVQCPSKNATIKLSVDKGELIIKFNASGICDYVYRDFNVDANDIPIYIDDPRVLDCVSDNSFSKELLSPVFNIYKKSNKISGKNDNVAANIKIIQISEKIQNEISSIEQLMNGKFIIQNGNVKFKDNDISDAISIENLSLGMKSMGILERCLSSGFIQERSVIILDEPEIHLHPEWQMKYAEYIVILQKALNLKILITTHSPYFLRAIECYSDNYDTMDSLNVYAFENDKIKNCSYSEYGVSEIYEKMTQPYDELQDMIDRKYGDIDE